MPGLPHIPLAELRWGDGAAIFVYFVLTAMFAVWYGGRNNDTEGYLLGGRNMRGWAVGLSLVGTSISSISFLALPAAAYSLDWRPIVPNYAVALGFTVAVLVFVPLFRALPYMTTYEFLEHRLGRFSRLYCALTFMFAQLIRLSAVLYLASIAVSVLLGVRIETVIIFGGVVGGIFLLAIFVKRVGPTALLVALPFSLLPKVWYLLGSNGLIPESLHIPLHAYWIGVVSNVTLMVLAFALSFIWPRRNGDVPPAGGSVVVPLTLQA